MKKIVPVLIFTIFAGLFVVLTAQKQSSAQLKKDKQNVQNQIKQKQKLLDETRKNKKATQQQLGIIRDQIATREQYMALLQNEINSLSIERERKQAESNQLNRRLTYLKEDYSRVVYNAYKNRNLKNRLLFILSAESYSQMFTRMRYYNSFASNVKRHVDEISATMETIKLKTQELALIEQEKETTMSEQEQQNYAQQKQRREIEQTQNKLKKTESNLVAEIKKKQAEQKKIDAAIKKAIEAEIAAANAKKQKKEKKENSSSSSGHSSTPTMVMTPAEQQLSSSFAGNKGKLPWPLASCAVISTYGQHPHPDAPSVSVMNNGIDLLTQSGATVKAVFNGEVRRVINCGGTNVVIIRHGEYLTVYQNLTGIKVKEGATVTTGQAIGSVSKSASDTYELHFELLKGGTYQNPKDWLKKL